MIPVNPLFHERILPSISVAAFHGLQEVVNGALELIVDLERELHPQPSMGVLHCFEEYRGDEKLPTDIAHLTTTEALSLVVPSIKGVNRHRNREMEGQVCGVLVVLDVLCQRELEDSVAGQTPAQAESQ